MTNQTSNTVVWASSEPFDVPAYVTGEWGEYVSYIGINGTMFSADIMNARVFTPEEQRNFVANHKGVKRFYAVAAYTAMLELANETRGDYA